MRPPKHLRWILADQDDDSPSASDGHDEFVSLTSLSVEGSNSDGVGLGLSAPYLQWLDIIRTWDQELLYPDELIPYVDELENYLWDHFEQLEQEDSQPSALLREGLLGFISLGEELREILQSDGLPVEEWSIRAQEANLLLLQGRQQALTLLESP